MMLSAAFWDWCDKLLVKATTWGVVGCSTRLTQQTPFLLVHASNIYTHVMQQLLRGQSREALVPKKRGLTPPIFPIFAANYQ